MNGIRTITLDLDDTLWAIGPVIGRAEQALDDWLDLNLPGVTSRFGSEQRLDLRKAVVTEFAHRRHDLTFIRREILRRMGAAAGYDESFVDHAFAVFEEARNTLELFPDVRPALASLKTRYRIIAVTNGNAKLDRIGIADLFDGFVSARTAGAAKPARPIFDAAIRIGEAEPHETLHVGDHPEADVDGARAAGLRTAWVNRTGVPWPDTLSAPDRVVADLAELEQLLMAGP